MQKDFDTWNKEKKAIHQNGIAPFYHEREVWWCALGVNVGVEIDGKHTTFERPAVILRKFNNQMLWVIPVTSQVKSSPFYEPFTFDEKEYFAALTQLRTVSTKRLLRKIGMIPKEAFVRIREKTAAFIMNEDPQSGSSRRPKP
jgi:mRNA interferase MazF